MITRIEGIVSTVHFMTEEVRGYSRRARVREGICSTRLRVHFQMRVSEEVMGRDEADGIYEQEYWEVRELTDGRHK